MGRNSGQRAVNEGSGTGFRDLVPGLRTEGLNGSSVPQLRAPEVGSSDVVYAGDLDSEIL